MDELRKLLEPLLKPLVKEAVGEAMAEQRPHNPDELLDKNEAARAMRCCTKTLDVMRKRGMPCVYLGDSPRFHLPDCVEWLKRNASKKNS